METKPVVQTERPIGFPFTPTQIRWAALILAGVAIYTLLHETYRIEDMDNAWSLSFIYNFLFKGITYDVTFGATTGGGGVQCFGMTFAYVYGLLLSLFGWTKSNALLVSSFFILTSAGIWFAIIRHLTQNQKLAAIFALVMPITAGFFLAAHEARPDALTFFILSAAVYCFIREWYFGAGLLAMVAWETHPMGIYTFCYFAGLAAADWERLRREFSLSKVVFLGIGISCGILYYISLHYPYLHDILRELLGSNKGHRGELPNFMLQYFCSADHGWHLLEFLLFAGSLWYFLKTRGYEKNRFIIPMLVALIIPLFILKRPNYRYIIYIYPVFLWLMLEVFTWAGRLRLSVILLISLMLPLCGVALCFNHNYSITTYLQDVTSAVPADHLPVVGNADSWFAFKDRDFYSLNYVGSFRALRLTEFYLIEDPGYREGKYRSLCKVIKKDYRPVLIKGFRANGQEYRVERLERRAGK